MSGCPDCDAFWPDAAGRMETHRLWKHPTTAEKARIRTEIAALGTDLDDALARGDVLRARMLLGHLHQAVLRAMTYLDDDLDNEVAA
ncbi:hypothetical protein [Nocardia brasiliensis]|uniref:hypothetical protein n=1 Tax=Nocardia brasiliensis TaxID=37326 RepID=UPI002454267C|nr:hypothetical protein [Nocardia brasiliensis]